MIILFTLTALVAASLILLFKKITIINKLLKEDIFIIVMVLMFIFTPVFFFKYDLENDGKIIKTFQSYEKIISKQIK